MADVQTTDTPQDTSASTGYCKRQVGLLGILLIISGIGSVGQVLMRDNYGAGVNVILYIAWGLSFLWIEVADKGDYLLVTTGPCRWLMCGWGKEKVKYSDVRDFEIVKSCWFMTPGVCCTGVKTRHSLSIPFCIRRKSPIHFSADSGPYIE